MKNNQSGQALLMVLLSVGVILTIALSVVARSVTDISTSTKDEESLRAFSAAEAGIEQVLQVPLAAMQTGQASPVQIGNSSTNFTASTASFPSNLRSYVYPVDLFSGDSATVWFSSHDVYNQPTCASGARCLTSNTMDLCWGKTGVDIAQQPAIAVSVLYGDVGTLKYAYIAFDPNTSRASENNFISAGITTNTSSGACTITGTQLANKVSLNLNTNLLIPLADISGKKLRGMTTMLLYNTAPTILGITNINSDLPDQGKLLESTGVSGTSARKVQVYALYPEVPSMFQSAIYSPPGIVK